MRKQGWAAPNAREQKRNGPPFIWHMVHQVSLGWANLGRCSCKGHQAKEIDYFPARSSYTYNGICRECFITATRRALLARRRREPGPKALDSALERAEFPASGPGGISGVQLHKKCISNSARFGSRSIWYWWMAPAHRRQFFFFLTTDIVDH